MATAISTVTDHTDDRENLYEVERAEPMLHQTTIFFFSKIILPATITTYIILQEPFQKRLFSFFKLFQF